MPELFARPARWLCWLWLCTALLARPITHRPTPPLHATQAGPAALVAQLVDIAGPPGTAAAVVTQVQSSPGFTPRAPSQLLLLAHHPITLPHTKPPEPTVLLEQPQTANTHHVTSPSPVALFTHRPSQPHLLGIHPIFMQESMTFKSMSTSDTASSKASSLFDLDEHGTKSILVYKYRSGANGLDCTTEGALCAELDKRE